MKKVGLLVAMMLLCTMLFAGCEVKTGNRITYGKDVQTFTYAYIKLGGEDIAKGFITQWRDYDNSDVVQVLIDGRYYLTHYTNVVMIADPSHGSLSYSNAAAFGVDE